MNPVFAHDTRLQLHDLGVTISYRDASAGGGSGAIITTGADGEPLQAIVDHDPARLQPEDARRTWADNIACAISRLDLPDGVEPRADTVLISGKWRPVALIADPDDPAFYRLAVGR